MITTARPRWALPTLGSLSSAFRSANQDEVQTSPLTIDPSFKRILVYLFIGSRGGQNRVRIIESLRNEPTNSNRLSEKLALDYKTIQHHLKILEENGVIIPNEKGAYGALYFLTPYFEKYYTAAKSMWAKFGQS